MLIPVYLSRIVRSKIKNATCLLNNKTVPLIVIEKEKIGKSVPYLNFYETL